jgi:hypothetical protein
VNLRDEMDRRYSKRPRATMPSAAVDVVCTSRHSDGRQRWDVVEKPAIALFPHAFNGPDHWSFMFSCGYSASPYQAHGTYP